MKNRFCVLRTDIPLLPSPPPLLLKIGYLKGRGHPPSGIASAVSLNSVRPKNNIIYPLFRLRNTKTNCHFFVYFGAVKNKRSNPKKNCILNTSLTYPLVRWLTLLSFVLKNT